MSTANIGNVRQTYTTSVAAYATRKQRTTDAAKESDATLTGQTAERIDTAAASEISAGAETKSAAAAGTQETAVKQDTYQSTATRTSSASTEGVIYGRNATLVNQLKADQEAIQLRFLNMVQNTLTKQGKQVATGDGIWKQIAQGNFEVDPETQAEAKQAISADGYWGVEKTSQRMFDFAKALVGGDPSRVEEMRNAFIKGFEEATKAWGGTLPDITQKTYDATMKLFDEWANEGKTDA